MPSEPFSATWWVEQIEKESKRRPPTNNGVGLGQILTGNFANPLFIERQEEVLQKQPKKAEFQRKWDRFSHAMVAAWLSPYWVMLGAGSLGWGWSYWKSFLVESMVVFPLGCVIGSAMRWWKDADA